MPAAAERFTTEASVASLYRRKAAKIEAVSKVSALRKLGVFARVARDQVGRSRAANAVMSAVSTTVRSFGRALHQLWLEVTGLLFLLMALAFAGASFKEYGKYHAGQVGSGRLAIAVGCTVAFAWFGLSSFWRVRRKGQR